MASELCRRPNSLVESASVLSACLPSDACQSVRLCDTLSVDIRWLPLLVLCVALGCAPAATKNDDREEVIFWHFWGGKDRPVVDGVIERFNASQSKYRVRGIAMPGANLDLKFLLGVAGGDPPDLLNHDDAPIVADWAHRGALMPLSKVASEQELQELRGWLFPAAKSLASYEGRLYALPNGLDIRALYYNKTWLKELGVEPPRSIQELDALSELVAPPGSKELERVGYLPDPRRLWAWGPVFGGRFADLSASSPEEMIQADSPQILAALDWMAGYAKRYGGDRIATFRTGDQALAGASFPLLADRRYALLMDGQWRVRDLAEADSEDEYGVIPLPEPVNGKENAGWVNGNLFVIPHGAKQAGGAWEFMKFWSGFSHEKEGSEIEAARICSQGGWVPVSQKVVETERFEGFLEKKPLFRLFVELASSEHQHPTPALPVASFYYRELISAAEDVMYRDADPKQRLERCAERVRRQLAALLSSP